MKVGGFELNFIAEIRLSDPSGWRSHYSIDTLIDYANTFSDSIMVNIGSMYGGGLETISYVFRRLEGKPFIVKGFFDDIKLVKTIVNNYNVDKIYFMDVINGNINKELHPSRCIFDIDVNTLSNLKNDGLLYTDSGYVLNKNVHQLDFHNTLNGYIDLDVPNIIYNYPLIRNTSDILSFANYLKGFVVSKRLVEFCKSIKY